MFDERMKESLKNMIFQLNKLENCNNFSISSAGVIRGENINIGINLALGEILQELRSEYLKYIENGAKV